MKTPIVLWIVMLAFLFGCFANLASAWLLRRTAETLSTVRIQVHGEFVPAVPNAESKANEGT